MKVKNVGLPIVFLISLIMILVGVFVGYRLAGDSVPKNCAEIGVAYLEIGKKELGITDYGLEQWNKLVDDETKLTNDCYQSLGN